MNILLALGQIIITIVAWIVIVPAGIGSMMGIIFLAEHLHGDESPVDEPYRMPAAVLVGLSLLCTWFQIIVFLRTIPWLRAVMG